MELQCEIFAAEGPNPNRTLTLVLCSPVASNLSGIGEDSLNRPHKPAPTLPFDPISRPTSRSQTSLPHGPLWPGRPSERPLSLVSQHASVVTWCSSFVCFPAVCSRCSAAAPRLESKICISAYLNCNSVLKSTAPVSTGITRGVKYMVSQSHKCFFCPLTSDESQ